MLEMYYKRISSLIVMVLNYVLYYLLFVSFFLCPAIRHSDIRQNALFHALDGYTNPEFLRTFNHIHGKAFCDRVEGGCVLHYSTNRVCVAELMEEACQKGLGSSACVSLGRPQWKLELPQS